jgi:hypothetical protein
MLFGHLCVSTMYFIQHNGMEASMLPALLMALSTVVTILNQRSLDQLRHSESARRSRHMAVSMRRVKESAVRDISDFRSSYILPKSPMQYCLAPLNVFEDVPLGHNKR